MRILILSDLHHDFWTQSGRDPFEGVEDIFAGLDHLLLAGDISNKPTIRWKFAFERLSKLLPLSKVSVFPGNHDFYDFRIDGEDRLTEIAAAYGVGYVQKKQLTFGKTRILCATLWTDFELGLGSAINKSSVAAQMNDYKKIRVASKGYRRLWPSDVLAIHRDHKRWLENSLSTPFDGRTIVATHHAPHPSVLEMHADSVASAYASDLSDLVNTYEPNCWYFGHCHGTQGGQLGSTPFVNASLGYPDEVADPASRIASLVFET